MDGQKKEEKNRKKRKKEKKTEWDIELLRKCFVGFVADEASISS